MSWRDQIKKFSAQLQLLWRREYQLHLFNNQTLQGTRDIHFTVGQAFFVGILAIGSLVLLTTLLIFFTPLRELTPGYTDTEYIRRQQELIRLVDSLDQVTARQDTFIRSLQRMTGLEASAPSLPATAPKEASPSTSSNIQKGPIEQPATGWRDLEKHQLLIGSPILSALARVTAPFSPENYHWAVDMAAPEGTPVSAVGAGCVVAAYPSLLYGKTVVIHHVNGLVTVYKHLSRVAVRENQLVQTGDAVGVIGNTGENTSGPHLHFEVWYRGQPRNPLLFLPILAKP